MQNWAKLVIVAAAVLVLSGCSRSESIRCDLPEMSRDAFMSRFESDLAANGGDSSPFTFLILTDDWKEAEPSDKLSSVKMTLSSGNGRSVSREGMKLCTRAMIAAAFSADDGWTDDMTDRMMESYDSGQPVSIDNIDGYRLYCSFTSEGGSMLIEPYCEQCIYDLQR